MASQSFDDAHATLARKSYCCPTGLGLGSIFQLLPFQRSVSVPVFDWPTALQVDADEHETPFKYPPPRGGLAVDRILQLLPSQLSARVPELECPTATQSVVDVQDTLARSFEVDPVGLGVGSIDHRFPSHRSARVTCTPEAPVEVPTAVQSSAEIHET